MFGDSVHTLSAYCLFGMDFFWFFVFYVWIGMFLKGMVESSLLFKDECLTPNIDEVMPVRNLRKRAQITKISDFWGGYAQYIIYAAATIVRRALKSILRTSTLPWQFPETFFGEKNNFEASKIVQAKIIDIFHTK